MLGSYITNNEIETINLGKRFSELLIKGDVVALYGDLGTGKTQFIKGICKGFKIAEEITSPTFTIMNIYEGIEKVFHFDFYRLNSEEELFYLGITDFLNSNGICLIEWAEKGKSFLPKEKYEIFFDHGENENIRKIKINKT